MIRFSSLHSINRMGINRMGTVPSRQRFPAGQPVCQQRRGSTLVVVISLMGLLSLLGLMFFTFANQEQENALNFSGAAAHVENPELDTDVYFNWALRQMIVGPDYSEKNSALWGGRHAILSNAYGHDATPHNGQPLVLSLDGAGNAIVDMDFDGSGDRVAVPGVAQSEWPTLADIADSPSANFSASGGYPFERNLKAFPEPDVDFTYPDINNIFLAHVGHAYNGNSGQLELVIKPSYHRPELFVQADGSGGLRRNPNWATAAGTTSRLLRPHPGHAHVPANIVAGQSYERRFLDSSNTSDGAIISSLPGLSGGFPFRLDLDGDNVFNEQGVWSRQGLAGAPINYEYDVDNNKDGTPDSILMDLDFPVQETPAGHKYVPLFAAMILDADSLFNLNIHGNLSGDTSPATFVTPTPGSLPRNWNRNSLSSLGLTPSEVNWMWGLDAVPGSTDFVSGATPFTHLAQYFGFTGTPSDRWAVANMLNWWVNKGAVEYGASGGDRVIAGRLGEASKVEELRQGAGGGSIINFNQGNNRWYFPYPGIFNRDDNNDFNEGGSQSYVIPAGTVTVQPNTAYAQSLPFRHPLPLSGRGLFWNHGPNPALRKAQAVSGNPSQWLQYDNVGIAGNVTWRTLLSGNLMQNTQFGVQGFSASGADNQLFTADDIHFDDMMEIILEQDFTQRPHDEPFTWQDAAALQLSSGDVANTGEESRAIDLLAPLFDPQNCNRAVDIRRMFTTHSWDRKQFPLARLFQPGPDGAPGVSGKDDNNNNLVDDPAEYGWPYSDDARAWEFNYDIDNDGQAEFPPQFSGGDGRETAYYGYHQNNPQQSTSLEFNVRGTIASDPFRPQLRRLLEVEWGNRTDRRLQFRLNLNQLLDVSRTSNQGHPYYSPLGYRPLYPHSTDDTLNAVHTVNGYYDTASTSLSQVPPFPPQNQQQVEFWARYDRQRMARDIYVMLYTLCGGYDTSSAGAGNDGTYPDYPLHTNAGRSVYSNVQLRRMAQFAVNTVDALDRDNVTTAFEYDTNLANGWGLDDQPWVAGGPPSASNPVGDTDPSDRAVVYGVEAQELTLSETLWVYQDQYGAMGMDNPKTMYNETSGEHHFLYTELRSTAPGSTRLAVPNVSTGKATAIWRIRRVDGTSTAIPQNPPLNPTQPQDLEADTRTSLTAPENAVYFLSNAGTVQSVSPGGLFSISTGDDYSSGGSSDLYVDYDDDGDFDLIAPRLPGVSVGGSGSLTPRCNLDLVHTNHQNRFKLDNGSTGDFLNSATAAGVPAITIMLERRLNPDLPNLPLSVNPWIVMDTTVASRRDFNLTETDITPVQIQPRLQVLTSRERPQPFQGLNLNTHTGDTPLIRFNSLRASAATGTNKSSPSAFNLLQLHFDRDFASVVELLSVPLRGPRYLTQSLQNAGRVPATQRTAAIGPDTAGPMFLLASHPSNPDFNNHWHRLLGMLEVPTRMHRQLGNPLNFTRVPGRINLNTMRYPEIMAGLLDDPQLHDTPERTGSVDYNANSTVDYGVRDRNTTGPTARDYWFDTLRTRDGVDPVSGMVLPGTTSSRPFRDPAILQTRSGSGGSGQDSLLRAHPKSINSTGLSATDRHLFDTGTNLGGNNAGTNYYLKNRLLSKLQGNVTTRSNGFFVFLTVRFHEVDDTTGAVRIGGQYDLNQDGAVNGDDEHRGFFVLDRSDAEKAYDPGTGTFRWEDIVKHRVTIN